MDITDLTVECAKGTTVKVWCKCHTADDVEDVIAWLRLAKTFMQGWEKINAKASCTAKAASGQNADHQPGKVLRPSQGEGRANGEHLSEANTGSVT